MCVTGSGHGKPYSWAGWQQRQQSGIPEAALQACNCSRVPDPHLLLCCIRHGGMQLAVLHPRKLVVYSVAPMGNGYLHPNKLYEHGLDHTAANMCYGPFGGASGVDYICVQSYDGQLSIFECEGFAFARFLPNFLVPGPLAYCEQSDSFVTCNCAFELESYKYKALAAATAEKQEPPAGSGGAGSGSVGHHPVGKRVAADWRMILGEMALDIRPGRLTPGLQAYQADLVVLCEHHVFLISSAGQITFQKRLEYHPACACVYAVPGAKGPGGPDNLLVATHTRNLLVYRGSTLVGGGHKGGWGTQGGYTGGVGGGHRRQRTGWVRSTGDGHVWVRNTGGSTRVSGEHRGCTRIGKVVYAGGWNTRGAAWFTAEHRYGHLGCPNVADAPCLC